jgi:hypothetical protein
MMPRARIRAGCLENIALLTPSRALKGRKKGPDGAQAGQSDHIHEVERVRRLQAYAHLSI